jgi:hypothetical protein
MVGFMVGSVYLPTIARTLSHGGNDRSSMTRGCALKACNAVKQFAPGWGKNATLAADLIDLRPQNLALTRCMAENKVQKCRYSGSVEADDCV